MAIRRLATISAAILAAVVPVAGADTQIDRLGNVSTASALHGWLAWTREDTSAHTWSIVVRPPQGAPAPLAITPLPRRPTFDLGTDAANRMVLVLSRCHSRKGSCDLSVVRLPSGQEQPIRGVSKAGTDELEPTVWRGVLAFVSLRPHGRPVVVERKLGAPASTPVRALPSLPPHAGHPRIDGLDLGLAGLAENVHLDDPDEGICGQSRIQLVNVATRHVRLIDKATCGLSGQTFVGPTQSGGEVGWAMFCPGDPGGCSIWGGALRQQLHSGRRERIARPQPDRWVTGFALQGARAYLVDQVNRDTPCDTQREPGPRDCELVALDPGAWRRVPTRP